MEDSAGVLGRIAWSDHYAEPSSRPYAWGHDPLADLMERVRALEERLGRLEKSHE